MLFVATLQDVGTMKKKSLIAVVLCAVGVANVAAENQVGTESLRVCYLLYTVRNTGQKRHYFCIVLKSQYNRQEFGRVLAPF